MDLKSNALSTDQQGQRNFDKKNFTFYCITLWKEVFLPKFLCQHIAVDSTLTRGLYLYFWRYNEKYKLELGQTSISIWKLGRVKVSSYIFTKVFRETSELQLFILILKLCDSDFRGWVILHWTAGHLNFKVQSTFEMVRALCS